VCGYDPYEPGVKGAAEEMYHCAFPGANVSYTSDIKEALTDAKYIISSGGAPRKEGMTREDLLKGNAQIAEQLGKDIKSYCPDVKFAVIIFNPADITGLVTLVHSGLHPSKVGTWAQFLSEPGPSVGDDGEGCDRGAGLSLAGRGLCERLRLRKDHDGHGNEVDLQWGSVVDARRASRGNRCPESFLCPLDQTAGRSDRKGRITAAGGLVERESEFVIFPSGAFVHILPPGRISDTGRDGRLECPSYSRWRTNVRAWRSRGEGLPLRPGRERGPHGWDR
jgi:hypothetical protein